MRVVFGTLEDMVSELKEKGVKEVRVDALYDKKYSQQTPGVAFLRLYVNVDAVLPDRASLYGVPSRYQEITYDGINPMGDVEKGRELREANKEAYEKLKSQLAEEGFTVRAGHFED